MNTPVQIKGRYNLHIHVDIEPRSSQRRNLMKEMRFLRPVKKGSRSYIFVEKGTKPTDPLYEMEYDKTTVRN